MNHATTLPVEEIHLALLQAVPEGMCFTDLQGAVRFWNDAAEEISGFSVAEAVCARHAEDVFFLSGPDGQPASFPAISEGESETPEGNYFLRHKDGHYVPVFVRRVAVQAQSDLPIGVLNLFTIPDGSESRAETRRDLVHHAVRPAGIVLIQIDKFEDLSHRLGPEAAEKLEAMVERTTAFCLKDGDSYRCLPDGVVLASVSAATSQDLSDLAERIRALIQSARIQWWGDFVSVTVSMGLAQVHAHDTVADAIGRAEDSVVRARAGGGNRVVVG